MIKKFIEYVNEDVDIDTLGKYVSDLAEKDDYIKTLIGEYTGDIDPSITMANAINILDDDDKLDILKRVEYHVNGEEGEVDVDVHEVEEVIEENTSFGKGVFTTFLKCLTALGLKDNKPEVNNIPPEYLVIFKFEDVPYEKVKSVFNRFKSLSRVEIEGSISVNLFFGLNVSNVISYGVGDTVIGSFKLGKRELNTFEKTNISSLAGFRKVISGLDINEIRLLSTIKNSMSDFSLGNVEKMSPQVNSRIISFGYYGYGNWNNGVMGEEDLSRLKGKVKTHLSNYKWSDKVQMSIVPSNFWVYIHIKLK